MGTIKNISFLDARNATEESVKNITKIENILVLICTEETAKLLETIQKKNVLRFIKIPNDLGLDPIVINGNSKIDGVFLESIQEKAYILVNGRCIIKDITPEMFNEKVYKLDVNGEILCPSSLKGLVLAKGSINGRILDYKDGYTPIGNTLYLTENNILKYNCEKLSVDRLIAIDPIDDDFEEYIERIQIQEQAYITKSNLKRIRHIIDDLDEIDLSIVPENSVYREDTVYLNPDNIISYHDATLIVDGKVYIENLSEDLLKENIKGIYCDGIYCDEKLINAARALLMNQASVKVISSSSICNTGKMVLNKAYLEGLNEKIFVQNMGKLILDESVEPELLIEKISGIENFGKLVGKSSILSQIKIDNLGVIEMSDQNNKEREQDEILYSNLGTLVL